MNSRWWWGYAVSVVMHYLSAYVTGAEHWFLYLVSPKNAASVIQGRGRASATHEANNMINSPFRIVCIKEVRIVVIPARLQQQRSCALKNTRNGNEQGFWKRH